MEDPRVTLRTLALGLPLSPLPERPPRDESVPHAPVRRNGLRPDQRKLAVANALRYFPAEHHATLAPEFAEELLTEGHIYMHRFRPTAYAMRAYPIDFYPAKCPEAACIQLLIMNNLDPQVAQYPHELITYGGNGCCLANWAQYHLLMAYLSNMERTQTLSMYSGHPAGLFPSCSAAPRMVITNGMVIPNYSSREEYEAMHALGVTMYGQMTAGSYCYIGPQGIVHGTLLTILNAGRKYLGSADLRGKVFVTAGLGGMSGAQAKAAVIAGAVGVVAEVNPAALYKRHAQGWLKEVTTTVGECIASARAAAAEGRSTSIGFLGNVVDLWEALAADPEGLVALGSDQTSCHNPFNGGYYPAGLTFDEANALMAADPPRFAEAVRASLCRQLVAINKLSARGMRFWDYGNSFLLEAGRAGADVFEAGKTTFKYPSYVQHIMGDIFSLGFGPFRWICSSGDPADLRATDGIAADCIRELLGAGPPAEVQQQYEDNLGWIVAAEENALVVGSQARILYSDAEGRVAIAKAFNAAIASGLLKGPVVCSRDHHDVSGTDSPWRETSNIEDGSMFCADMAIQNVIGDAARGATWVAIHNGGGTGWGEAINGGFGLVLDGTADAAERATRMLAWDVYNGVARRAWARNPSAIATIERAGSIVPGLCVTMPNLVAPAVLDSLGLWSGCGRAALK
eukprot:c6534_g1_i1.p1 GENE.c6534_g1_i1~~c6534_g1_i1.p1  ORF type:complete len:691 (+),score=111.86 c6534_g1_i1:23-2074(+)